MMEQQLPEGWQTVKFGDIAKHISQRVEPTRTDLSIYVGLEHLDPDSLKIKRHGVPSDVAGQKLLVKVGQIIFGKRRAYQRKVAVAQWDCICSAHAMVLEAKLDKMVPGFLPFFMQSDAFMSRAVSISEGSLSPTIKWKVLAHQEFKVPSKDRQQEILLRLMKAEDSIVLSESAICALQDVRRKQYRLIFERFESSLSMTGKQLFDIFGGQAPSKMKFSSLGELAYFKVDDFNNNDDSSNLVASSERFAAGEQSIKLSVLDSGFIVFPKRGAAIFKNRVGIIACRGITDTNLMALKCKNIESAYIKIYLEWFGLYNISDNSGIPQINNKHIEPLRIPVFDADFRSKIIGFEQDFKLSEGSLVKKTHFLKVVKTFLINSAVRK